MKYAVIPPETERIGAGVIGAAIEVHRHLGAGFLERIYQEASCLECTERKLPFEREKSVDVLYKGARIRGQRIDLVVGGCLVVELKAVATINVFVSFPLVIFVLFVASNLRALRGTPPRGSSLDIRQG